MIDAIKATEAWEKFDKSFPFDKFSVSHLKLPPLKFHDAYNGLATHGQLFLSLDIQAANFQAMKYFNPELVLNCKDWEELSKKFSPYDYFAKSKVFRLRIFNKIFQAEKPRKIWEFIILTVCEKLLTCNILNIDDFFSFSSDELIFSVKDMENMSYFITKIPDFLQKEFPEFSSFVKVEGFQVESIGNTKFSLKKVFLGLPTDLKTVKVAIKGAGDQEYLQCLKFYLEIPINEKDLYVGHKKYCEKIVFQK
jgi:hypothetical protein